jgi:hypothetical protein
VTFSVLADARVSWTVHDKHNEQCAEVGQLGTKFGKTKADSRVKEKIIAAARVHHFGVDAIVAAIHERDATTVLDKYGQAW